MKKNIFEDNDIKQLNEIIEVFNKFEKKKI